MFNKNTNTTRFRGMYFLKKFKNIMLKIFSSLIYFRLEIFFGKTHVLRYISDNNRPKFVLK
jgi:hypothetical protein